MTTSVTKTLAALAIVALPFSGAAFAGQSASSPAQTAQAGGAGQIPEECAQLTDAQERAACVKENTESK